MTDQQIHYFLEVVRHQSFTKAAESLYVTQPAVSRQIAALEESLGVSLFLRNANKIELSKEGQIYYDTFLKMQELLNQAEVQVYDYREKQNEELRVGILSGWDMAKFLPEIMSQFSKENGRVNLQTEVRDFRGLIDMLRQGKLDIIIDIDEAIVSKKDLIVYPLTKIQRILVYSKKIYKDKIKSPIDLRKETLWLITNDEVAGVTNLVKSYFESYGFEPICKNVPNTESCMAALHSGGYAVMDSWLRDLNNKEYGYVNLDSYHLVSIGQLKTNPRKTIDRFVDAAVKALK